MSSAFLDRLLQQSFSVIVLCIFCYAMYRIILKLIEKITSKDAELKEERTQVIVLYGKAIEAQNKTTEALNKSNDIKVQLMGMIKDLQIDLEKIKDRI